MTQKYNERYHKFIVQNFREAAQIPDLVGNEEIYNIVVAWDLIGSDEDYEILRQALKLEPLNQGDDVGA